MKRVPLRKKRATTMDTPNLIQVGTCVIMAGEHVVQKLRCIEITAKGFRFEDVMTGKKSLYISKAPYFRTGTPLFKNGLKCYPEGGILESKWVDSIMAEHFRGLVMELQDLYRDAQRAGGPNLFYWSMLVGTAIEACKGIKLREIRANDEEKYAEGLIYIFGIWRKQIPNLGGIIRAMDCIGVLTEDFLKFDMERAKRRGFEVDRLRTIGRRGERILKDLLSEKRSG